MIVICFLFYQFPWILVEVITPFFSVMTGHAPVFTEISPDYIFRVLATGLGRAWVDGDDHGFVDCFWGRSADDLGGDD